MTNTNVLHLGITPENATAVTALLADALPTATVEELRQDSWDAWEDVVFTDREEFDHEELGLGEDGIAYAWHLLVTFEGERDEVAALVDPAIRALLREGLLVPMLRESQRGIIANLSGLHWEDEYQTWRLRDGSRHRYALDVTRHDALSEEGKIPFEEMQATSKIERDRREVATGSAPAHCYDCRRSFNLEDLAVQVFEFSHEPSFSDTSEGMEGARIKAEQWARVARGM